MIGFLLDTNVPSELTNERPDPRVEAWLEDADDEQLYLSVITIGEVMEGLTAMPVGKRRSGIQLWIEDVLRPWFAGRILPIDEAAAERWGILAGQRSLQGRPLGVADGLIAATALQHDLTVVTRNVKDFDGLGVTVFNPWNSASS